MTDEQVATSLAAESLPLHRVVLRVAIVGGGGAGLFGLPAVGAFFLFRGMPGALPMAGVVALLFGLSLSGAEELSKRAGSRRHLVALGLTVLCPLVLTMGWNWIEGLLGGGYGAAWRGIGSMLRQLVADPVESLGWLLMIGTPFWAIVWARLWTEGESAQFRLWVVWLASLAGGMLSFWILCAWVAGSYDDSVARLILTVGWSLAAALGLCLGDLVDSRVAARLAARRAAAT